MSFRIVIFSLLVEHVIVEAMGAILDRGSLFAATIAALAALRANIINPCSIG